MVSVYIRETLIQLWTPDAVRGRVNAVNIVFVGASNELGEFRAGTVAALIGVVPAVVIGAIGTVGVAVAVDGAVPAAPQGPPPLRPGLTVACHFAAAMPGARPATELSPVPAGPAHTWYVTC